MKRTVSGEGCRTIVGDEGGRGEEGKRGGRDLGRHYPVLCGIFRIAL